MGLLSEAVQCPCLCQCSVLLSRRFLNSSMTSWDNKFHSFKRTCEHQDRLTVSTTSYCVLSSYTRKLIARTVLGQLPPFLSWPCTFQLDHISFFIILEYSQTPSPAPVPSLSLLSTPEHSVSFLKCGDHAMDTTHNILHPRPGVRFYSNVTTLRSGLCCRNSVCLSVVCLSVTLVHPSQGVEPFGKISSPLCTLAILWPPCKILRK